MGTEDEIRRYLVEGLSPVDLVNSYHYKKSTVYKIYSEMKMVESQATTSQWVVEDVRLDKQRYQPRDRVSISYRLRNSSSMDLYAYRVGLELEWMHKDNKWYVHGERFLLHPQEAKKLQGMFEVPPDLPLGEYDLRFGIEGQFLSPTSIGQVTMNQTYWSTPLVFEVKRPIAGIKVFISHSTENMSLVRSLANYLDNQSITPMIAEEVSTPGTYLPEKFENEIKQCDIFLALLTSEAVRSKWVLHEVNYALKTLRKPSILLKEESVELKTEYEWTQFSLREPIESIALKVSGAINALRNQLTRQITLPIGAIILAAVLAFIAGLAVASR